MTARTVSNAVATVDRSPTALIKEYEGDFAAVLPSHIKSETWVRLAVGAFRRDKKLAEAANNDPFAMMAALLEAARLGHEPGTDQYYLTVRKERGVPKVKGIEGYRGIIERIYRTGEVASVIVEVVREKDKFTYAPGRDERPVHEIKWDVEDRGLLRLVYSYAIMRSGATSKVVVLNRAKVMEAKARSDSKNSEYSPWNTNEEAMWLKTGARRLEPWVPKSPEYLREKLRAEAAAVDARPALGLPSAPLPSEMDPETGEIVEAVEGELLDEDDLPINEQWAGRP